MLGGLHHLAVIHAFIDDAIGGDAILRNGAGDGQQGDRRDCGEQIWAHRTGNPRNIPLWVRGYVPIAGHASNRINRNPQKTYKTALTGAASFGIGPASLRWSDTPEGWPSG
ncbi:hypothetical protein SPKIRA_17140 [Sphingomonas paucimobilis]|nr:hypothetical protein SPKIRA_17140 [Sphingomonas paucimobilis]